MFWWIVDNLTLVLVLLGCIAASFGAAWWNYRRDKLLIGVAVPVGLMVLAWVLSLFIVTDRMQLVRNVEAMRDLFNAGKVDEALEHFDDTVTVGTSSGTMKYKKQDLKAVTAGNMKNYKVKTVIVNAIEVEEVTRPTAKVTFYVGPDDLPQRGLCKMGFVLSPDGRWRVSTFTVVNPIGGQEMPLLLPFGG